MSVLGTQQLLPGRYSWALAGGNNVDASASDLSTREMVVISNYRYGMLSRSTARAINAIAGNRTPCLANEQFVDVRKGGCRTGE